jgi:hypothetical protein
MSEIEVDVVGMPLNEGVLSYLPGSSLKNYEA